MLIKLVGFANIDFTDDEGKKVQGTKIHFLREDPLNDYLVGNVAEQKFVHRNASQGLDFRALIGELLDVDLDFKARIINIKKVEK